MPARETDNRVTVNGLPIPDADSYYDRIKDEASLVAYFPLTEPVSDDGRVLDTHGGRVGTVTGTDPFIRNSGLPGSTTGNAFSFGTSGTIVSVPYEAALNPSTVSVEAWVRIDAGGSTNAFIYENRGGANTTGFLLWVNSSDTLAFRVTKSGGNAEATLANVPTEEWLHVAGTYDGTNVKLFVNGVERSSTALGAAHTPTTSGAATIGSDGDGSSGMRGDIAHVAIYNTALNPAQINAHYSELAHRILQLDPVGYWRLNEASGTTAVGLQDYVAVTEGDADLVAYWPLSDDSGADRTGSHDGTVTGSPDAVSSVGVPKEKALDFDGSSDYMAAAYNAALNPANFTVEMWIYRDTDTGSGEVLIGNYTATHGFGINISGSDKVQMLLGDGSALSAAAPSTTSIATGQWYHVVCTYNGTNATTFINGSQEATVADGYTARTSGVFAVAATDAGTSKFPGDIAHVAIYNAAKDATWVANKYAIGTDASGVVDGTYTNTPTLGVPGAAIDDPATATDFNGTDEYVTVAYDASLSVSTPCALSFFVKPPAGAVAKNLVTAGDEAANGGFRAYIDGNGDIGVARHAVSGDAYDTVTGDFNSDDWNHVVFVQGVGGASTSAIYVNGELKDSGVAFAMAANVSDPINIAQNNSTQYFDGPMQDVALFDRELTASEISHIYEAFRAVKQPTYNKEILRMDPVAFWPLDEASGTTAVDATGNGKDLTYTNTPTLGVAGGVVNAGTAVSFAAASSEYAVDGAFDADLAPSTIGVAMWVKPDSSNTGSQRFIVNTNAALTKGVQLRWDGSANKVYLGSGDGAALSEVATTGTLTDDAWNFIYFDHDGTDYNIYVAGSLDKSGSDTMTPNDDNALRLGCNHLASGNFLDGDMQGVALFDRALSADEIAYLWKLGKAGIEDRI